MSHLDNIEETLAYDMIVLATDRLSQYLDEDDWDAAIIGALIRATEIASKRKVKSIHEIYETKPLWLGNKQGNFVYQDWKVKHEQPCCCQNTGTQNPQLLLKGKTQCEMTFNTMPLELVWCQSLMALTLLTNKKQPCWILTIRGNKKSGPCLMMTMSSDNV